MGTGLLSDIRREIDERLRQLRPAVEEYERLLEAAEAVEQWDGSGPAEDLPPARAAAGRARGARARRARGAEPQDGAVGEAILGALEHGSHTPAELAVVTGTETAPISRELRQLLALGLVAKTEREGKLAWSLATSG
jgi:hypothetical protein